jgi:uncharacterized protein
MSQPVSQPWWKFGHVWLVIAGPVVVVVASFITLYLAVTRPDPVIDDYYRKGVEVNKALDESDHNLAPAVQARNHAQTGVSPKKIFGIER